MEEQQSCSRAVRVGFGLFIVGAQDVGIAVIFQGKDNQAGFL